MTDTAWLKLHEKDSRHYRYTHTRARAAALSLPSLTIYSTFTGGTHRFTCDGGHKIEANGHRLADRERGKERKERGDERDLTSNLQRRQTSERVIFQTTAVTDVKRGKESDKKTDRAIWLSDSSEL